MAPGTTWAGAPGHQAREAPPRHEVCPPGLPRGHGLGGGVPCVAPQGQLTEPRETPHGLLGLHLHAPPPVCPGKGAWGARAMPRPLAERNPGTPSLPGVTPAAPPPQEDAAAVPAAQGPGSGGAGLLQPGQHVHATTRLRARGGVPPPAPAHRPGAGRQVCPAGPRRATAARSASDHQGTPGLSLPPTGRDWGAPGRWLAGPQSLARCPPRATPAPLPPSFHICVHVSLWRDGPTDKTPKRTAARRSGG